MAFYPCEKYKRDLPDVNEEFRKIKGEISDAQARVFLGKYLRNNLDFTVNLITGGVGGGIEIELFQEVLLKGMMNSNFTLNVWGRGVGKTASYSSTYVVSKDHGFIKLKNLFPNLDFSKDDLIDIPETNLWNGSDWQKTTKLFIQPQKDCLKIRTKRGYELIGSTNHLIKTINYSNKQCEIVWKKYPEITQDDYICISRNNSSDWTDGSDKINDAYLVGLLIGDGCYSNKSRGASLVSADDEILDFCKGSEFYSSCSPKKGSIASQIYFKRTIENFLNDWVMDRGTSYFKEIPQKILSSKNLLKSCLQGLLDTDGCCESRTVSFCSTSVELAKQVHLSLSLFGVVSTIAERKTDSPFGKAWVITVTGKKDLQKFADNVGFRLSRKQNRLQSFLNNEVKSNTNNDIIPGAKEFLQTVKTKHRLPKILSDEWRNKIRRKENQEHLTYDTVQKYLEFFKKAGIPESEYPNITEIVNEDFFFDKVESIEELKEDCVDFNIPIGERYWTNGFISHNSWLAAVYCILQTIFEPGSKILIAGPTFRTSRAIFDEIERIVNRPGAALLKQCFDKDPSKRSDIFSWEANGGIIRAIPLNGEKIRGFRANILVIDEFLLVPEDLVKNVLMPFLASPQNLAEMISVRKMENELIKQGKMTEAERMKFQNTSKLIGLSSASFTFENLYRTYKDWVSKIEMGSEEQINAMKKEGLYTEGMSLPRYCVSRLAYNAVPEHMMDPLVIMEAKAGGAESPSFKREYGAQFSDGSESYFGAKKMALCTVGSNEYPTVQIFAKKGSKYIISIDPSFSDEEASDHFSISVLLINDDDEIPALVHNYVVAGGQLSDHYDYFYFLYTQFRPEFLIIDNAGWEFINGACESTKFKNANIKINFIEFDSTLEGVEYEKMLIAAKQQYNKHNHTVAIKQFFSADFIRKSNEHLKGLIDCKKIKFASALQYHDVEYDLVIKKLETEGLPFKLSDTDPNKNFQCIEDYIDFQDNQIYKTKEECAIIELKVTNQGNYSFRIPLKFSKDRTKGRVRRDSYTTLLLGSWANKCYYDMMRQMAEETESTFEFSIY